MVEVEAARKGLKELRYNGSIVSNSASDYQEQFVDFDIEGSAAAVLLSTRLVHNGSSVMASGPSGSHCHCDSNSISLYLSLHGVVTG